MEFSMKVRVCFRHIVSLISGDPIASHVLLALHLPLTQELLLFQDSGSTHWVLFFVMFEATNWVLESKLSDGMVQPKRLGRFW